MKDISFTRNILCPVCQKEYLEPTSRYSSTVYICDNSEQYYINSNNHSHFYKVYYSNNTFFSVIIIDPFRIEFSNEGIKLTSLEYCRFNVYKMGYGSRSKTITLNNNAFDINDIDGLKIKLEKYKVLL